MPDENGNLTAGDANVATPGPTPVAPDIGATPPIVPGEAPSIGARTASSLATPVRPTGNPTFFRQLLFTLGKGLIEGTKAGLQAPLGPQGPPIAAQTAIQAPQKAREQLTTNQMNDLNVAMSQLKLHQLQMITNQMEDDQQNAMYNKGRDTLTEFIDKGKADVIASGDLKSIHDEFSRRQADAKQAGQGLLPLFILPSPGSSASDPKYSLVNIGKERLTEDMDETWGAADLGISEEDFKSAGLTKFPFHASEGMEAQKALNLKLTQKLAWASKAMNQLGQMKRTQVTQAGANYRTNLAIDARLKIAQMNNATRRAGVLVNSGDKEKIAAAQLVLKARDKLADVQGKESDWKDWIGLDTNTKQATVEARSAFDDAVARMSAIDKKGGGAAPAKIRVRLSNGKTGTINENEFDGKTMTKLGPAMQVNR